MKSIDQDNSSFEYSTFNFYNDNRNKIGLNNDESKQKFSFRETVGHALFASFFGLTIAAGSYFSGYQSGKTDGAKSKEPTFLYYEFSPSSTYSGNFFVETKDGEKYKIDINSPMESYEYNLLPYSGKGLDTYIDDYNKDRVYDGSI